MVRAPGVPQCPLLIRVSRKEPDLAMNHSLLVRVGDRVNLPATWQEGKPVSRKVVT